MNEEQISNLKPGDKVNYFGMRGVCIIDRFETRVPSWSMNKTPVEFVHFHSEKTGHADYLTKSTLLTASLDLTAEACAYCGKELKEGEYEYSVIFVNRGQQRRAYCKDSPCACYDQMGAEG